MRYGGGGLGGFGGAENRGKESDESEMREVESAVVGRSWAAELRRAAGFFFGGTASGQVHWSVECRMSPIAPKF